MAEDSPLEAAVRRVLLAPDLPCYSSRALVALSDVTTGRSPVQRVADVIRSDLGFTLKVLRNANSAYYRRGGESVTTVEHATLLLGASTIRRLASVLPAYDEVRWSAALPRLLLMSVLTGYAARSLANELGYSDGEEAYLAGLFYNLGEVLVAGYAPLEYARVVTRIGVAYRALGTAALETLGFSFEDLGEAIGSKYGLSESVVRAMRGGAVGRHQSLGAIAACATDLTWAAKGGVRGEPVESVCARYADALHLTNEMARRVLRRASEGLPPWLCAIDVGVDDGRVREDRDGVLAPTGALARWTPPGVWSVEASYKERRRALLDDMRLAGDVDSGEEVVRVIVRALEAIVHGGPCGRAVFCAVSADRLTVQAQLGVGEAVDAMLERLNFELVPRSGPVAVIMLRRQGVFVPFEREMSVQEAHFAEDVGASAFGVFPIVVGTRLLGGVYCDRAVGEAVLDRGGAGFVREVCSVLERGIVARRRAAGEELGGVVVEARPTPSPLRETPTYAKVVQREAVRRTLAGEEMQAVADELAIPTEVLKSWHGGDLES